LLDARLTNAFQAARLFPKSLREVLRRLGAEHDEDQDLAVPHTTPSPREATHAADHEFPEARALAPVESHVIAVTLSVQTQDIDPVTRQFQVETKTLLNVSPRNVFNTWQLASMLQTNRIQPIPASVLALLQ